MAISNPSLNDLLRLSFSKPVRWLSGENRARSAVHCQWVTVSGETAQPDDLLLFPSTFIDGKLLALAQSRGAAAVLLLGESAPSIDHLPEDLPVAWVAENIDIRTAQRALLTLLINQRATLMERGVRVHAHLSQLTANGEGLEGLAIAMTEISGRGILIQDKRLHILAQSPSPDLASAWDNTIHQWLSADHLPEALRDRKAAGRQSPIILQDFPGNISRLILPITVGEVARGYLSVIGSAGELDALDRIVAEQGALVCAVEMARTKAVREAEKRLKGDLLTALLQEDLSPRDARLWAQNMGLDLNQSHVALRFTWDGASPPSRRRLETIVNGEVARQDLQVIVNPMASEVICFCQVPPAPGRPETAIQLAQAVVEQGRKEFPENPIRSGLGTAAPALDEWRASFRQAGQALEMARRLRAGRPLYFPDLSVFRLLLQIEHNPELVAFQEEILGPLLAYDGGEELIHTLEAYFKHNANLSQTAEALFIHRNTLIYRMERIAGITGLDLDEPETRLALQLALHIHRMMGSRR